MKQRSWFLRKRNELFEHLLGVFHQGRDSALTYFNSPITLSGVGARGAEEKEVERTLLFELPPFARSTPNSLGEITLSGPPPSVTRIPLPALGVGVRLTAGQLEAGCMCHVGLTLVQSDTNPRNVLGQIRERGLLPCESLGSGDKASAGMREAAV